MENVVYRPQFLEHLMTGGLLRKCPYVKRSDIKCHKSPPVKHRSWRVIAIFDDPFTHQSESISLLFIFHTNETEPARNGWSAPRNRTVWLHEIRTRKGERCRYSIAGWSSTVCAFWQRWVGFCNGF
jgi:hypothetical protein